MTQDIDDALRGWDYNPGMVQARLVQARDDRQVIQLRIDLGVLQIETTGKPDGTKPHGHETYFDYLKSQDQLARTAGKTFTLSEEQCFESDREFIQYYHRRLCWLALHDYARAIADADHTLAFMDFVRDHSPDEAYTEDHEKYRGFVLFHRTQAAASLAVDQKRPEAAIDEIATGIRRLHDFFTEHGLEEQMDSNPMVEQLRKLQETLRSRHEIGETLHEQLERAVANEEYETAARLRDVLRTRSERKDEE